MAYQKKVTQSKFNAVKTLLKGGATVREVMEYLELSDNTVYMIKQAETLVEYENMIAEKALRDKQRAAKAKQEAAQKVAAEVGTMPAAKLAQQTPAAPQVMNPTVIRLEATHYMMEEMKRTNELLTCISAKLAFIVDELCGVPQKKE